MKLFPVVALMVALVSEQAISGNDKFSADSSSAEKSDRTSKRAHCPGRDGRKSSICQNYDADVNDELSQQIQRELNASYSYMVMGNFFARDDQALRGFAKFFLKMSDEERSHAQAIVDYVHKRGGSVTYGSLPHPKTTEWSSGLAAMETALEMERDINNHLLNLHKLSDEKNDYHLSDYLEATLLSEQVDSLKQLGDFVTVLEKVRHEQLGELWFDNELFEGKR